MEGGEWDEEEGITITLRASQVSGQYFMAIPCMQ